MTSIGHFDNLCREGDKTWDIFVTKIMKSPFTPSLYLDFSRVLSLSLFLPPSLIVSLPLSPITISLYTSPFISLYVSLLPSLSSNHIYLYIPMYFFLICLSLSLPSNSLSPVIIPQTPSLYFGSKAWDSSPNHGQGHLGHLNCFFGTYCIKLFHKSFLGSYET